MNMSFGDKIFLSVGLIDFGGIFLWIGVCLHLGYTKMDHMLDHLRNRSLLHTLTPLKHSGPWGKLLLVGSISSVLAFPESYLKRGKISPDDLHKFPLALKRKLVILQWVGLTLLLTMVGLAAVTKLGVV